MKAWEHRRRQISANGEAFPVDCVHKPLGVEITNFRNQIGSSIKMVGDVSTQTDESTSQRRARLWNRALQIDTNTSTETLPPLSILVFQLFGLLVAT